MLATLICISPFPTAAWTQPDIGSLVKKMEAAYAEVEDYQANLEVKTRRKDGAFATKRVLYTFKKPDRIRLEFESPYRGMVLLYPGPEGNVVVRPPGWTNVFKLRLAPNSFLLQVSPGQPIHQTNLGLLIENMAHSLTDRRRGPVKLTKDEAVIRIRVLADNHFQEGVVTRYAFVIDQTLWLPIEVRESRPAGALERIVVFRNLKVNLDIPDSFFQLDGE